MFYLDNTDEQQQAMYEEMLQIMGSLSNLFSDSEKPYLVSRLTENLFCKYLNAENLSRGDITADAKKNNIGIGIKTWVGTSAQKIAEFNRDRQSYANLTLEEKIRRIAELRNERIAFTMRSQGLERMDYHCTLRDTAVIKVAECPLVPIDCDSINHIEDNGASISFRDNLNSYSFNLSKSTLYKRFDDLVVIRELPVEIIEDPFALLYELFHNNANITEITAPDVPVADGEIFLERAYLPLYSTNRAGKYVPPKNNLNMRFAGGRPRNIYEVGIPVPASFRRLHPDFFPGLNSFELYLPNGEVLSAKRCQQDGKALMSNPNSALGHWLIDTVLQIDPEQIITYDMLGRFGIDAVKIDKYYFTEENKFIYKLNFACSGSYEIYMGTPNVTEEEQEQGE